MTREVLVACRALHVILALWDGRRPSPQPDLQPAVLGFNGERTGLRRLAVTVVCACSS